ncbi:hypothetical protein ZIOFF_003586 [Zingiber officinale]|uniref:Neprosin PEP catalytic domain-containing protein n=1 Tax=Zingiber officinale TaxID=94328 RepID=A0A8J5ITV4_ZINOF|nr:hypothetical protein ZIOFF_003586 [Zingiber officinale]
MRATHHSCMLWLMLSGICVASGEERRVVNGTLSAHKHSIKAIENDFGDIYDCVDIYKQPAFDHPLLQNLTLQMKPTTSLPNVNQGNFTSRLTASVGMMKESCPSGTIPILRRNLREDYKYLLTPSPTTGVVHFAQIKMARGKYYGSAADLNVYGLLEVGADQFSSSAIWVLNDGDGLGPLEQTNGITVGWTVNPPLYGDTNTRLFTFWTADGFQKQGCYDLQCPGFVQVSRDVPLGGTISPLSQIDGTQYYIRLLIYRDPVTENWWLVMGEEEKLIGYWPKALFSTMIAHANLINWGGSAYSSSGEWSPPMGSGRYCEAGEGEACYFGRVKLVGERNVYRAVGDEEVKYYSSGCYDVGEFDDLSSGGGQFLFGGPGYC